MQGFQSKPAPNTSQKLLQAFPPDIILWKKTPYGYHIYTRLHIKTCADFQEMFSGLHLAPHAGQSNAL